MKESEKEKIAKKMQQRSEIEKDLEPLYKVETRYSIVLLILSFGSLNIQRIAKILGKNEATIYHHIKELTKDKSFLKVDEEATMTKKGIYYDLEDKVKEFFREPPIEILEKKLPEKLDDLLTKSNEEISDYYKMIITSSPDLGNNAEKERKKLVFNHTIENFLIYNFKKVENALKEGKEPLNKRYPVGGISNINIDLKVAYHRHFFEFMKEFTKFQVNIHKLQEKINLEIEKEKIPKKELVHLHYHLVGGELTEFSFEEKSKRKQKK